MASLHIINHLADVPSCLPFMAEDDALMLCGDAVYALRQSINPATQLYALAEDIRARGLESFTQAKAVDYSEFVALCTAYAKVVAW